MLVLCSDISALARAAVSGDEKALDMFTWKKGRTNKIFRGNEESMTFYLGGQNGNKKEEKTSLVIMVILRKKMHFSVNSNDIFFCNFTLEYNIFFF